MKELLVVILVFIVFTDSMIIALLGMKAARVTYQTKSIGSEMKLYRKLLFKTMLMYIVVL